MPKQPDPKAARGALASPRDAWSTATGIIVDTTSIVESRRSASPRNRQQTIERFANRVRRLPTFSEVFRGYRGPIDGASDRLRRAARILNGRFVIANSRSSVSLPDGLRQRLLKVSELADECTASSIDIALEEPTDFVIRHSGGGRASSAGGLDNVFTATISYVVRVEFRGELRSESRSLEELSESTGDGNSEDHPWFRVGLCIPDHMALKRMSPETAHYYRWITGRLGQGSTDEYWHLDAWDQFTEAGRTGGILVPEFLRLPPRSPRSSERGEPNAFESGGYEPSMWPPLTARVERGALIPPGFCFVEFDGTITLRVSAVDVDAPRTRARL